MGKILIKVKTVVAKNNLWLVLFIGLVTTFNYAVAILLASQPVRKFSNGVKVRYLCLFLFLFVSFLTGQGGCLGNTNTSSGSSSAPIVSTTAATNVNYNSATLNGTVNPNGFDTTCYFYWESAALMTINDTTTPQNIDAGTGTVNVSANITALQSQMGIGDYEYRIIASNSSGTSYGEFQSFNIFP